MFTIIRASRLLCLCFLIGCGNSNSLVGRWIVDEFPEAPPGAKGEMVYSDDEKVVLKMLLEEMNGVKINMEITVGGTYTQSGNKVTHRFSSVDIKSGAFNEDQMRQFNALMEPKKAEFLELFNKMGMVLIEWKSKDEVALKTSKDELRLKRA